MIKINLSFEAYGNSERILIRRDKDDAVILVSGRGRKSLQTFSISKDRLEDLSFNGFLEVSILKLIPWRSWDMAMAMTSFQATARAIGRRAWRILHTAGMHYFWLAFMMEFAFRAMTNWIYFTFTLPVLFTMVIRLWPKPKLIAMSRNY